jgi:hypothetical protein
MMHAVGSTGRMAALLILALAPAPASAGADEFLPLQANAPGSFNYARVADIQVFLDASPTRCSVFLTNGQEIKAFQTCTSITAHLDQQHGLVTLPSPFGSVLLAPSFVSSLIAVNNGGCRLNLRNGVWVPVIQTCRDVLQAIARP